MRGRAVCLAVWLAVCVGPATATEQKPFETIRSLQALQDKIALGDAVAAAAHAKAMERAARVFARAKPDTWTDPRNARALVIYLFSGGSAQLVADTVPESAVAPEVRPLYKGAIAYGLGDDETARKVLMPIDAKAMSGAVGGRLALVQAILCTEEQRTKAIALLDVARLFEPGTLIEEAALRKELWLIGVNGDLDKFGLLARRYTGAFSRSIYAENFRQLIAATATQIGTGNTLEAGLRLSRVALNLSRGEQRVLYLAIAREAVLAGRTTMAGFAADQAARLSQKGEPDEARAMVYLGAAAIVGDRYEHGRKVLLDAAPARLGASDRALRDSAIAVAEMIRRTPAAAVDVRDKAAQAAVLADGERALSRADATLSEASR